MYELLQVLTFTWSRINTITLQLPYQLTASSTALIHYLSLSPVLPDCRRARVFIALPGRAHACPLPGARPTRRNRWPQKRAAARASWSRHQIHRCSWSHVQTCPSRDPHAILECADPGPSWIGSNTGLADKSPPQVNQYTCWAGSAPTPTTHAADWSH